MSSALLLAGLLPLAADLPTLPSPSEEAVLTLRAAAPLTSGERSHLARALHVAARRLDTRSTCSALFEERGVDGRRLLEKAEFFKQSRSTPGPCQSPGVSLFTTLHGHRVGICPGFFDRFDRHMGAALLLHEALHMAGMSEFPVDPAGLQPAEITRLVRLSCKL